MLPRSLARQNISAVRRSVSGARVVRVTELRETFFAKSIHLGDEPPKVPILKLRDLSWGPPLITFASMDRTPAGTN